MGLSKKQKNVFDFIVSYTRTEGVAPTQKEIKDHFGLKSFGSVQRYLKYLSEAGYIEQDWNAKRGLKVRKESLKTGGDNTISLALLGDTAAGNPIEAIENPGETIDIPASMINSHYRHFALNVCGDSMIEDGILDADIIICRHQEDANNGQTVVALIDGHATVKKLHKYDDRLELHPANSKLKPYIFQQDQIADIQIAGIVVGLLRLYS